VSWADRLKETPVAKLGWSRPEFISLDSAQDICGDIKENALGLD
jgi:hypothetical protein